MMVIVAAFASCTPPEPTAYPPEPLPEVLASLTRPAQIQCRSDPVLDRGSVYLWSSPGTFIADPDSGVFGRIGDEIGTIEMCEPIQIIPFYRDAYATGVLGQESDYL
jgi:hypothetical protein